MKETVVLPGTELGLRFNVAGKTVFGVVADPVPATLSGVCKTTAWETAGDAIDGDEAGVSAEFKLKDVADFGVSLDSEAMGAIDDSGDLKDTCEAADGAIVGDVNVADGVRAGAVFDGKDIADFGVCLDSETVGVIDDSGDLNDNCDASDEAITGDVTAVDEVIAVDEVRADSVLVDFGVCLDSEIIGVLEDNGVTKDTCETPDFVVDVAAVDEVRVGSLSAGEAVLPSCVCLDSETSGEFDEKVLYDVSEKETRPVVFDLADSEPAVEAGFDTKGVTLVTAVGATMAADTGLAFTGVSGSIFVTFPDSETLAGAGAACVRTAVSGRIESVAAAVFDAAAVLDMADPFDAPAVFDEAGVLDGLAKDDVFAGWRPKFGADSIC